VYVSGLPTDITMEEFEEFMKKCGLILYDHVTRKLKIKLYKDANGENKGDGICSYIKVSSGSILVFLKNLTLLLNNYNVLSF
jgi:HIV Tat-specific factor 1